MDLKLTPEEAAFRDEVRAWLKENMPEPYKGRPRTKEHYEFLRQWQRKLFDGGWAGIHWPKEYGGRGATVIEQAIFQQEMSLANAPEVIGVIGLAIVGPTIIAVGSEEQKQRHLEKILSGEEIWCQGFSEPNAGSDLASLATRAVDQGDHWIVNGQKIWTSYAHIADWCLLLVRTDPEAKKHEGITALLVDMHGEGVSTKPLRQMTGAADFNEIYFTNAPVPKTQLFGEVDRGWNAAIATLMNERANLGSGLYLMSKRFFDELLADVKKATRNGKPLTEDPVVRQQIAQAFIELEVYRLNSFRALSKLASQGMPGPEGSILKLFWSEMNQRTTNLALDILGPRAALEETEEGKYNFHFLRSRGNTIEAGTSEVLRNIISQRVLGLPKSY